MARVYASWFWVFELRANKPILPEGDQALPPEKGAERGCLIVNVGC